MAAPMESSSNRHVQITPLSRLRPVLSEPSQPATSQTAPATVLSSVMTIPHAIYVSSSLLELASQPRSACDSGTVPAVAHSSSATGPSRKRRRTENEPLARIVQVIYAYPVVKV